jgi:uridine phosphorylase
MKITDFLLVEYDPTVPAIVEPTQIVKNINAPTHCVICFFGEVIANLSQAGSLQIIAHHKWEDIDRPLYEMEYDNKRLAVFQPGVGAPIAVALFEELIARGCRNFIACGGAGVLDRDIAVGNILVPTEAVRDEGTSFHYLPPARSVSADPAVLKVIEDVLQGHGISYRLVKTWTTDAPYRETLEKIKVRRAEGCLTVEMETAAFFAASQFRGTAFGQLLYGGDDVSGPLWDERGWHDHNDVRMRLFNLAAEICLNL